MTKIISLITGIIFGIGLTVSEMINPQKVLGFLNIFRDWDPSLMFVMVGGILIFSPLHYIFKRKARPILVENFFSQKNNEIDKKLIMGSGLFGIGWGLVGLCPGPAISSLSFLNVNVFLFIASMILGFYLARAIIKT